MGKKGIKINRQTRIGEKQPRGEVSICIQVRKKDKEKDSLSSKHSKLENSVREEVGEKEETFPSWDEKGRERELTEEN